MKLAFCDDDQNIVSVLRDYAESWANSTGIAVECKGFRNSEDFLLAWTSSSMFDAIFLDIKMERLSGIELAKVIRSISAEVSIVFITGYSEFALDGYSVDAASYLLKPVSRDAFHECMGRLTRRISHDQQKAFLVEKNGQTIKFRHSELLYFEVHSHMITVHTTRGVIDFRARMSDIEEDLTPEDGFVRIHRSFLVNIKQVRVMDKASVVMENGVRLSIGRSYSREAYNEYIRQDSK